MSVMSTETQILPEIDPEVSEPDGKRHYVRIKALIEGGPVVAMCGKKYIPTVVGAGVFDHEQCAPCEELFKLLQSMDPPE